MAWDRYAYVYNNPIIYNDPSGHDADCGIGDSYCGSLRREYMHSDWQKHLTFKKFIAGKDAYNFYYKYEDKAFEDTYIGEDKDSIMWARIYSEDVLHRPFEPISDFMVLDRIEIARDEKDFDLFYKLATGFALLEWMSSDKGFGGGYGGQQGWTFGRNHTTQKWANQMNNRGWTVLQIDEAILLGEQFPAINRVNPNNSATRFVHPVTGRSVVMDDVTFEILHIGGDGYGY